MTPARTKKKTVKKKPPTTKKKPAPKKKPPLVKKPAAKAAPPDKKKPAAKPDPKKAAAATPSARDLAYADAAKRQGVQEARAKKAPKVRPSRAREPGKRPDLPLPTPVERPHGVAGALGEKYVCFSCGKKFYDLGKPEPICPKCGSDQREAPRPSKTRPPAPVPEVTERPVKRSRLLDDDDDEIAVEPDVDAEADDDLDLGLGDVGVDDGEDFGTDEPEEEEVEEEP
jgi:hypothetical protein